MTKKRKRWIFILVLLVLIPVVAVSCIMKVPKGVRADRNIEYAKVDGHSLKLDIYRPKLITKRLPAVIWLYGGGWKYGSKMICPIVYIATQQVAVVSINYRLDDVAKFPAQIHDCKGAIRWLRANADRYNLDADHIGVFGISAGGHLAALLGTTANNSQMEGKVGGNLNFSSQVQCVCAFYPPTDLNRLITDAKSRNDPNNIVAELIGGPLNQHVKEAEFASPISYVSGNAAPIFLMHGGADTLVPSEQSQILYDAFQRVGVEAHLEIIPGKGHGISAPPQVAEEIYQFFRKHLQVSP
jgi:acetyl esterase/lipase